MMTTPQLGLWGSRLRALRDELLRAGDLEIASELEPVKKPDDDAAPLAEMNQVIASNRNRERAERLRAIDDALRRLADDPENFGICEGCDEPIPPRRLELSPWVRRCIPCQEIDDENRATNKSRRHITDYR